MKATIEGYRRFSRDDFPRDGKGIGANCSRVNQVFLNRKPKIYLLTLYRSIFIQNLIDVFCQIKIYVLESMCTCPTDHK